MVGIGVLRSCDRDIACSAGNNVTYRLNLKIDSASKVCPLKATNINQSSIYALYVNYDRLWSFFVFI